MSSCAGNEPFALQVLGNSMAPEFPDGCVVIVEPDGPIKNGSYVVANTEKEVVLRRVRIEHGKWWLEALKFDFRDCKSVAFQCPS